MSGRFETSRYTCHSFLPRALTGRALLTFLTTGPMSDVVKDIFRLVAGIRYVARGIKESDHQASRLFKRVATIGPRVLAFKQGTGLSSSESLRQLLVTVKEIGNFLDEYVQTNDIDRAFKREAHAAKFTQLGAILIERMEALRRDIMVDAWAKEDASDRLKDLENMMDVMKQMGRRGTDDHAPVTGKDTAVMHALKVSLERTGNVAAIWQSPPLTFLAAFVRCPVFSSMPRTDLRNTRCFSPSVGDRGCHVMHKSKYLAVRGVQTSHKIDVVFHLETLQVRAEIDKEDYR